MRRLFRLAILLALSQVLHAQPTQTATAPSTATATRMPSGSTGTNAEPSDPKANSSRLHWLAENLKDIAFIASAAFTVILIIVAAVLITKRGRVMILGAVLDGLATDAPSAQRLYDGVLLSDEKCAKILSAVLNGLAADPASAKRLYDCVLQSEKAHEDILGCVLDGIAADSARARKIYDLVMRVDEDRTKIYDRVIQTDDGRGKITTAVIRRLSEDSNSSRQLLDLIVWEFGGNRSKDFADLLAKRENQQILKAMHDIRAVTGTQDAAQKDDK